MGEMITEATLITLLGGFISIISILIKYRLDNKKSIKNIEKLAEEITRHDKEQDEKINKLGDKVDTLSANFERFTTENQLNNKILFKFFEMQHGLNDVIVKDIKNGEHNGDLESAEKKIDNFKEIINEKFLNNK